MVGKCALAVCGTSAAAITLLTFPTITLGAGLAGANPGANGVTRVALDADLKDCDFSLTRNPPMIPSPMLGTGWVEIIHTGSSAVAQVHLDVPNEPGAHYSVGLIEEPRSSSATCGPGDPGTSFTGLDTDAAGVGTATVHDGLRSGTTGVWVIIERPNAHSQDPAEYYTSEFLAPV
jgi:hypothetical protein